MRYQPSPTIAASGTVLVVGNVTASVIPAPGPGFAIRLVGGQMSITRLATGIVDAAVTDSTGRNIWIMRGLQTSGMSGAPLILPEPGIQLGENLGVTVSWTSTAAAGSGTSVLYYHIDQLS